MGATIASFPMIPVQWDECATPVTPMISLFFFLPWTPGAFGFPSIKIYDPSFLAVYRLRLGIFLSEFCVGEGSPPLSCTASWVAGLGIFIAFIYVAFGLMSQIFIFELSTQAWFVERLSTPKLFAGRFLTIWVQCWRHPSKKGKWAKSSWDYKPVATCGSYLKEVFRFFFF